MHELIPLLHAEDAEVTQRTRNFNLIFYEISEVSEKTLQLIHIPV